MAFDRVRSDLADISRLWQALADRPVEFRRDVLPLPGFRDPGTLLLCSSMYPTLKASAAEGKKVLEKAKRLERDRDLALSAKARNRQQNGGQIVCEACKLTDEKGALFDVHHIWPLHFGERETLLEQLAVLCPTCHRWAHVKAPDPLSPLPLHEIRKARG
jgi:predicted HNH restriction endonuclease